jgi:hypothetical protein
MQNINLTVAPMRIDARIKYKVPMLNGAVGPPGIRLSRTSAKLVFDIVLFAGL